MPQDPAPESNRKSPRGFTLIELLVVMAIIAVLAGLVLQTAGFVQKKAATSRAEAEIAALSTALESYKADFGDYPTNSATSNNANLVAALSPSTGKVYYETNKSAVISGSYIDPFGVNYIYQFPGGTTRSGSNFFDLYSTAGSSTAASNAPKWIKNW